MMDLEGQAYRLVGSLPYLGVLMFGVWLAFHQRWRNPRVCTLVGVALLLAMGINLVFPVVINLFLQFFMNQIEMDEMRWRLFSLIQSFIYSSPSAVVWGLVLWAIFGGGGVVRSTPYPDDDLDETFSPMEKP